MVRGEDRTFDYTASLEWQTLNFSRSQYEVLLDKIKKNSVSLKEVVLGASSLPLHIEFPEEGFSFPASRPSDIESLASSLDGVIKNYDFCYQTSKKRLREMVPQNRVVTQFRKLYRRFFEYLSA